MSASARRRMAFIVPALLGLLLAQRAAANVRAVDFLTIFAGGVLLGVGVVGLARGIRETR
jgi:predicted membrane channel-forming protein YqfA (hemolysin III family)